MKTDKTRQTEKQESEQQQENIEIPGMDLNIQYTGKKPILPEGTEQLQKEMERTKKEFDRIKAAIIRKYPFTQAIGIIAPQAVKLFVEDELGDNIPKEELEKLQKKTHLYIIIPEEKFKEIPKIKKELISEIDKIRKDTWFYVKTPVDVWEACLDSKFELVSAIGMSFPLYDKGILVSLRVAEIHKALVLQKFDRYIVSYVIAGSMVRGDVSKESDVDVFIIINDTDVKRMPRLELRERLKGMIFGYIGEATALAGAKKNILNVQPYLLTDFWESVKDAHPVMFTFIRDGVPLYDRGTFLPWKALLKMGRLKPSPEAIEMFMSTGDKTVKRAKQALLDILIHDIYWSIVTPSQALIMLYGLPPPTPKQTASDMKKIFVDKENMLEKKYIAILERVIQAYKDFEHEKLKEVKGAEIDKMLADTEDYLKRLEELRKQIEKRAQEKTVEQVHKDIFNLLESMFGKKMQAELMADFEKLIKQGKFTQNHLRILRDVIAAKAEFKKGKLDSRKIDDVRKNASIFINDFIDYSQRADLMAMEKARMRLRYRKDGKPMVAELLHCDGASFLFIDGKVMKITNVINASDMKEVSSFLEQQKAKKGVEVNPGVFSILQKELGEFEIVL